MAYKMHYEIHLIINVDSREEIAGYDLDDSIPPGLIDVYGPAGEELLPGDPGWDISDNNIMYFNESIVEIASKLKLALQNMNEAGEIDAGIVSIIGGAHPRITLEKQDESAIQPVV